MSSSEKLQQIISQLRREVVGLSSQQLFTFEITK